MDDRNHAALPASPTPVDPAVNQTIIDHLNKVLESPQFRGSDRCKHFLDFVVHQALDGKGEELKERVVGVEVFGRPNDYETAGDAIVRVKANEVRKRLAQYYAQLPIRTPVRIELPAGSYVPRFDWRSDVGEESASSAPAVWPTSVRIGRRGFGRWLIRVPLTAAIIVTSLWLFRAARTTTIDQFWGPVLSGSGVPLICLGSGTEAYLLSDRLKEQIQSLPGRSDEPIPIPIASDDVVRLSNFFLSMGNFYTVMRISALLDARGKPPDFRSNPWVNLDDLRGRPVIFIGAFMNLWTLHANAALRFEFQGEPGRWGAKSIRDNMNPHKVWTVEKTYPWGPQAVDYAIVSRVWDRTSDSVFVTAAGINVFGTQAAGEFLSNPSYWKDLVRNLPRGWERKNLQIVLQTDIIGTTPSPPKAIASYVW
jgi:hypothetical protein